MYKIVNQTGDSTEILLYSLIEDGTTAGKLIRSLQSSPAGNITLRINSDGGEAFDALALYNYLKDKHVTVIIDGMCASAASVVAMCGEKIIMKGGSMMMIHNPITFAMGESEDLRNAAEMLDKVTVLITGVYKAKTGLTDEEVRELMNAQTWMTPEEALTYGFCDEIDRSGEFPPLQEGDRIFEDVTDAVKACQSGEGLHTLEARPDNDPLCQYNHGIQMERERLRALDELYTPSRANIINRAKYETGETAQEIALELLRNERESVRASAEVNNLKAGDTTEQAITAMAEYINRRRRT